MSRIYITQAGDQWDTIAKAVYDDEQRADLLMQADFKYLDIFQFDAGVQLVVPDESENSSTTLPPWRGDA